MKIYLVVDVENNPGRVVAIYRSEADADMHSEAYDRLVGSSEVQERTLHFGQAPDLHYSV